MKIISKLSAIAIINLFLCNCYFKSTAMITTITDKYDNGNVKVKEIKKRDGLHQKITFTINGDTLKVESYKDDKLINTKKY